MLVLLMGGGGGGGEETRGGEQSARKGAVGCASPYPHLRHPGVERVVEAELQRGVGDDLDYRRPA